ncbi:hypothetical protein K456DRAFT_315171 [Colletotrichum gloeosporioides 23]|nr:hypothetical protein K456DRAFT_315171 [Colletotrichum gloeosporioides 23]
MTLHCLPYRNLRTFSSPDTTSPLHLVYFYGYYALERKGERPGCIIHLVERRHPSHTTRLALLPSIAPAPRIHPFYFSHANLERTVSTVPRLCLILEQGSPSPSSSSLSLSLRYPRPQLKLHPDPPALARSTTLSFTITTITAHCLSVTTHSTAQQPGTAQTQGSALGTNQQQPLPSPSRLSWLLSGHLMSENSP